MTYEEFTHRLERLNEDTDAIDIYTSPDFQCDHTGGYPTSLCVNWDKGKAWLQLNDNIDPNGADVAKYEQLCADQFNQIVSSLGEDAKESATLYEDDEDFELSF